VLASSVGLLVLTATHAMQDPAFLPAELSLADPSDTMDVAQPFDPFAAAEPRSPDPDGWFSSPATSRARPASLAYPTSPARGLRLGYAAEAALASAGSCWLRGAADPYDDDGADPAGPSGAVSEGGSPAAANGAGVEVEVGGEFAAFCPLTLGAPHVFRCEGVEDENNVDGHPTPRSADESAGRVKGSVTLSTDHASLPLRLERAASCTERGAGAQAAER
jgi:hypothetical protein